MAEPTTRDETLSMVVDLIVYGWPKDKQDRPVLRAFFAVERQLRVLDGCIFKGLRAVISAELRGRVVQVAQ